MFKAALRSEYVSMKYSDRTLAYLAGLWIGLMIFELHTGGIRISLSEVKFLDL